MLWFISIFIRLCICARNIMRHLLEQNMKRFFTIVVLLCSIDVFSQSKNIVIQIDTLELRNGGENKIIFSVNVDNDFWRKNYLASKDDTASNTVLKYQQNIEINNDSSKIIIPIDNYGSRIVLIKNFLLFGDTIKLSKVVVNERLTTSTIYCKTVYYNPRRKKYKILKHRESCNVIKSPIKIDNLQLVINNSLYSSNFHDKESNGVISMYHGYNKRKYLNRNENYKFGVRKFYMDCRTKNKIRETKIEI